MSEKMIKKISDTEAIVKGDGGTSNFFAHVFRPALRTEDSWRHCCEKPTVDQIQACPRFGTGTMEQ